MPARCHLHKVGRLIPRNLQASLGLYMREICFVSIDFIVAFPKFVIVNAYHAN